VVEVVFDADALARNLAARLARAGVEVRLNVSAEVMDNHQHCVRVRATMLW
jgi:hypothetical protein